MFEKETNCFLELACAVFNANKHKRLMVKKQCFGTLISELTLKLNQTFNYFVNNMPQIPTYVSILILTDLDSQPFSSSFIIPLFVLSVIRKINK